MADNKPGNPPQEDRIISKLRPTPGQAPVGLTSYTGLLGKSPKEGYWLVYLTLELSQWVEINEADIIHSEQLPPDRSPFGSLGGTEVFVKNNATVTSSKTASQTHAANEPPDEFDLDVQLGGASAAMPAARPGTEAAVVTRLQICRTQANTQCATCRMTCGDGCDTNARYLC